MSDSDEDELGQETEVTMHSNDDLTEFTVVISCKHKLSTETICTELEFLAHELNRADGQRKRPGVAIH